MKVDHTSEARHSGPDNLSQGLKAADTVDAQAPRNLTFSENVALTIKILAIAGLLGALRWGIEVWTSGR